MLICLFFTRPYKATIVNWMAMFNELMIFVIGCYLFAFLISDAIGTTHRAYGFTITNLCIFLCVVNLIVVIPVKIREIW